MLERFKANLSTHFCGRLSTSKAAKLIEAVTKNNLQLIKKLLLSGAFVNHQRPSDLKTALHLAVENRNRSIILELLRSGARINLKARSGLTPIDELLQLKDDDPASVWDAETIYVAGRMLSFSKGLEKYCHSVAMKYFRPAIRLGNLDFVKVLLEYSNAESLLSTIVDDRETVVLLTVKYNQMKILKYFLSLPLCNWEQQLCHVTNNIKMEDHYHECYPFHIAVSKGYIGIVKYFIELIQSARNNFPISLEDKTNYRGLTPLMVAAIHGHLTIMNLLLEHDIDIDQVSFTRPGGNALVASILSPYGTGKCIVKLVQINSNMHSTSIHGERWHCLLIKKVLFTSKKECALAKYLAVAACPTGNELNQILECIPANDISENDHVKIKFRMEKSLGNLRDPRRLVDLCRKLIRQRMGKKFRFNLPKLCIPHGLKQFLLFSDLEYLIDDIDSQTRLQNTEILRIRNSRLYN